MCLPLLEDTLAHQSKTTAGEASVSCCMPVRTSQRVKCIIQAAIPQCKHRNNRHSVRRAAFHSDKHYSCHLNNFLSSKSTDESVHRCQVAPGRERQVAHSSFIQLFQLCGCIQIFHHVKQSICIRLYGRNHTKKSVEACLSRP